MNVVEICKYYSNAKRSYSGLDIAPCEPGVTCQSCRKWRDEWLEIKRDYNIPDDQLNNSLQTAITQAVADQYHGLSQ